MSTIRRDFLKRAGLSVGVAAAVTPMAVAQSANRAATGGVFDVRTFGATGDGKTIDTAAINRAIDAAAAAGGGTVHFPAGTYESYSIHLKSNVVLYLDMGAVIRAASTPMEGTASGGYDAAEESNGDNHFQDYGHSHWHNSLIWGENLHNFGIIGPGLIYGKGLSRGGGRDTPRAEAPGVGNKAIALKNCHNVLLKDFSVLQGGHFAVLATGVDNFTVDGVTIDTNRDGIDFDCCRNVHVANCSVNSPWDDGICPKSSYALGYARATENVTITNCYVSGCYELGAFLDGTFKKFAPDVRVPRTGRIKFGTESNGGFKNITVSNCVFDGCNGIALESVDGALLQDVSFNNITMRDISGAPIFLRLGSRMRGPQGVPIGQVQRVILSNIVSYNAAGKLSSIISGIPGHDIEDIKIHDIYLHHQGGGTAEMAAIQPPEFENKYPDPHMFGPELPASGFFVRHAKNLEFTNVEIAYEAPDERPAFIINSVQGADFFRVKVPSAAAGRVFALSGVTDFRTLACRGVQDMQLDKVDSKKM
jgi:polygalacturonase